MSRIVGSGLKFSGQADLTRCVGAKEIQGEEAQEGEALGGIAQANPASVFAEGHIEEPVQTVLEVDAHGVEDAPAVDSYCDLKRICLP